MPTNTKDRKKIANEVQKDAEKIFRNGYAAKQGNKVWLSSSVSRSKIHTANPIKKTRHRT
jgi:hypothetical protein